MGIPALSTTNNTDVIINLLLIVLNIKADLWKCFYQLIIYNYKIKHLHFGLLYKNKI